MGQELHFVRRASLTNKMKFLPQVGESHRQGGSYRWGRVGSEIGSRQYAPLESERGAREKKGSEMNLHDLEPAAGSTKKRKRVGRGHGSGYGGTSGRGMNGQGSRPGGTKGPGFEGGQTPLAMRLPKLGGFKNVNRKEYLPVNVSRLESKFEAGETVDKAALAERGIIKNPDALVKVLGDGDITKALTVSVDKVSANAQAKIEAAGGKVV